MSLELPIRIIDDSLTSEQIAAAAQRGAAAAGGPSLQLPPGGRIPGPSDLPIRGPSAGSQGGGPSLPGPGGQITGPRKPDTSVIDALTRSVQDVSSAFGVGGVTGTALNLNRAFNELYNSVMESAGQFRVPDISGARVGDVKSLPTPKPSAPITGPAPQPPVTKPPAAPSSGIPLPHGGVLPPSVIATAHGATQFMAGGGRVAAPPIIGPVAGPAPSPPITGPVAGTNSAQQVMAGLSISARTAAAGLGVLTGVVVGGAAAAKKAFDVLESESQRLGSLSGPLAASLAMGEVRSELADIRRANRIGPGLAKFQDYKADVTDKMAKAIDSILGILTDFIAEQRTAMNVVTTSAGVLSSHTSILAETAGAIGDFLTFQPEKAMDNLERLAKSAGEMAGHINKFMSDKDAEDKAETDPFFDEFVRMVTGQQAGDKPPRRAPERRKDNSDKLLPGSGFLRMG